MSTPARRATSSVLLRAAGVALAAVTLTPPAWAEEPVAPPGQYRPDSYPEPSARRTTLIAGATLAVGSYGVGVGSSFLWPDAPKAQELRWPVVGPWLALAETGCAPAESRCDTITLVVRSVLAGLSGVGQIGGLGVFIEGLFLPTQRRQPQVGSARRDEGFFDRLYATPIATEDATGLSIGGQF